MSGRAGFTALLLAALAACGVKAPPRAAGAPEQAPPSDLFRPVDDPSKPGVDFIKTDEEIALPAAPSAPVTPAAPAAPSAPPEETSR